MLSRRLNPPLLLLVGLMALLPVVGSPHAFGASSIAWAPDGKWLCFVDQSPPAATTLPVDWVFESSLESENRLALAKTAHPALALQARSKLWATKLDTRASVLIEDSEGLLAAPSWSPDGHSLAFLRLTPSPSGRGRFEVVVREGLNRRIFSSKQVDDWVHEVANLGKLAIAWSPDGRFLAIPTVNPNGLAIFRVETGRQIKSIDGAILPSWSPDGGKLLYVSTGDEDWLESLDNHFGASRHLADVGHLEAPPLFARDGQTVVVLARARAERGAASPSDVVELWRIRIDDGKKERLTTIATTTGEQVLHSTSIAADKDGENLFYATSISSEPSQVSWFRPRERSVYKRFPVLDPSFSLENLSLSPSGSTLALRLRGLPLLCDLDSMQLIPLVPDGDARAAWASLLLASAEALVRDLRPSPIVAGRAIDRPVALPMPGEIEANAEALQRFRRFGRAGHELVKGVKKDGPWSVAELIFDYLREDFTAALHDLDTIEGGVDESPMRLKMLNLRAQIFVGLNDFEKARGTLDYLKSIETERTQQIIEETSKGLTLSKIMSPDVGWAEYATSRISTLERELKKEDGEVGGPIVPTDHRNFDAPQPGLGLELPADLPARNFGPIPIRPNFPNQPLPENRQQLFRRPARPAQIK